MNCCPESTDLGCLDASLQPWSGMDGDVEAPCFVVVGPANHGTSCIWLWKMSPSVLDALLEVIELQKTRCGGCTDAIPMRGWVPRLEVKAGSSLR